MRPRFVSRSPLLVAADGKTFAMGRRWAQTFAQSALSEDELDRVAAAYVAVVGERKNDTIVEPDTGRVLVRLGEVVQVADAGQLWVFRPPLDTPSFTWTGPQMAEAYREHRATGAGAHAGAWLLHSFSRAARDLAETWSWQDLAEAFRRAGVAGGSSHDFFHDPAFPDKMRMIKGYNRRAGFYQACIGVAVRPLRQALAGDAFTAVWGTGNADGALFHWLQAGATPDQCRHRRQALRTQPALVPMALTLAGRLPNHNPQETDPEQAVPPALLAAEAEALVQAIDGGQRFVPALVALLNRVRAVRYARLRLHRKDQPLFVQAAQDRAQRRAWTEADVRALAPRRGRATLSFPVVRNHLADDDLVLAARLVHHLGADRQPRRVRDWVRVARLAHWLEVNQGQMADARVAHVFQGCPTSWDDPFYQDLNDRLCMLEDTLSHLMCDLQLPRGAAEAATRTLNLRQLFNFSEWAHAQEQRVIQAVEAEHRVQHQQTNHLAQTLVWSPALPDGRWIQATGEVVELLSPQDTEREGRQMQHCVGGSAYVTACLDGRSRLLSVRRRDPESTPLSTVELRWDERKQRPVVAQHFGFNNRPAPEEARRLVRALVRQLPSHPWPEHPQAAQWKMTTRRGSGTDLDARLLPLHASLWGELVWRYPAVARAVQAMDTSHA